jgi:hypothetical protein
MMALALGVLWLPDAAKKFEGGRYLELQKDQSVCPQALGFMRGTLRRMSLCRAETGETCANRDVSVTFDECPEGGSLVNCTAYGEFYDEGFQYGSSCVIMHKVIACYAMWIQREEMREAGKCMNSTKEEGEMTVERVECTYSGDQPRWSLLVTRRSASSGAVLSMVQRWHPPTMGMVDRWEGIKMVGAGEFNCSFEDETLGEGIELNELAP